MVVNVNEKSSDTYEIIEHHQIQNLASTDLTKGGLKIIYTDHN